MRIQLRAGAALVLLLSAAAATRAEVLVRWDQDRVPAPDATGISTLVVPAKNTAAVRSALERGYRVYLEVEGAALIHFTPPTARLAGVVVRGTAPAAQLRLLRQRLTAQGARLVVLDERGKWPHIRSNWVTRNRDVLQVSGRSSQPWIENNAALIRIAHTLEPRSTPMLTYAWQPIVPADVDQGPSLEDYLVGIAEAGSFGGDLLLPLHERFQRSLLLGDPQARAAWTEIRRYIGFFAWDVPAGYLPIANIGVIAAHPMLSYEVMNLLARHNLPFELLPAAELSANVPPRFKLLIVLDEPQGAQVETLARFERGGGKVVRAAKGVADPNAFALDIRRILGAQNRIVDIWNGITVLAAPYQEPGGTGVVVAAINYAHEPLPVQLRVLGTFSVVRYESPEENGVLLPLQQRDGATEFVLPALRVGGRVFLSR